jgi:hypothetical protein
VNLKLSAFYHEPNLKQPFMSTVIVTVVGRLSFTCYCADQGLAFEDMAARPGLQ